MSIVVDDDTKARIRRYLLGLTVCADCGHDRPIGAKDCPACHRCVSCAGFGCYRSCCWADADEEGARHGVKRARYSAVSELVLRSIALGPMPANVEIRKAVGQ